MESTNIKPHIIQWIPLEDTPEDHLYYLKYFPKYLNMIDTKLSAINNYKIRAKLKKCKVLYDIRIKDHYPKGAVKKVGHLKCLSQSIKRATIKDFKALTMFPNLERMTLDIYKLKSWRLFERMTCLKGLDIVFTNYSCNRNAVQTSSKLYNYLFYRFWKNILRLRGLNNFDVQVSNEFNWATFEFLRRLNQTETILKRIKKFSLFLNHANLIGDQTFPDLSKLFNRVTALQLHELNSTILQSIIERFDQFTDLTQLKLIQNLQIPYATDSTKINFANLGKLKSLKYLKEIYISINLGLNSCFETFLSHAALPHSIESITFNFFDTPWKSIIPDIENYKFEADNLFETSNLCQTFYNRWNQLSNLTSLSISFTESEDTYLASLYFILPIIERVNKLESLHYSQCYSTGTGRRCNLCVNSFLDRITHLKDTLKHLFIETYAISFKNLHNKDIEGFKRLERVDICGFIFGELNLEDFIKFFEVNIKQNSNFQIELERIVIENSYNFSLFLQILKKISKRLDLIIGIDVRKVCPFTFIEALYKFYNEENFYKEKMQVCFYNFNGSESEEFLELCDKLNEKELFKSLRILDRAEEDVYNSQAVKEVDYVFGTGNAMLEAGNMDNNGINYREQSSSSHNGEGISDMGSEDDMSGLYSEDFSDGFEDIDKDL